MFGRDEEGEPGDEDEHGGRNDGLSYMEREPSVKEKTDFKSRFWRFSQMCVGVVSYMVPCKTIGIISNS